MSPTTDPNCVFCRIVSGEIRADIVAETDNAFAFRDLAPQAPIHVLVAPRRHLAALRDVRDSDTELLGEMLLLTREVAKREGLFAGGFRVITNDGPDAGQTVPHLHFHVLGGQPLTAPLG